MKEFEEFEVSRVMSREEAGQYFIEVGRRLRDEGVVEVCGEEVAVPDRVELEVEYEREPGEAEFELEIEWRTGARHESSMGGAGTESGDAEPMSLPEFDDVKEEMKILMKEMHRAVVGNELPDRDTLDRFLELNDAFEKLAEGEPYVDRMGEYSEMVAALENSHATGDLDTFHGLLEEVSMAEDACHAEFR